MDRTEKLILIWHGEFPNYPLTVADLKKPHAMIGAFFQVFNRLGIDTDALLLPPPEDDRDEHTMYYWDLLPVINMTRVMNHFVFVLKQTDKLSFTFPLTITQFLQPDATTSHSILLLLVNLMAFNENRLRDISVLEEELFGKRDQVKSLEDKKNRLIETLNEQAEENGKRASRLQKIDHDIKLFEEELKQEKEAHDEEKKELDVLLEENKQLKAQVEQRNSHKESLLEEVASKRALRVYDAEDTRAKAEKATQNVQEAEDKLNSLRDTIRQKEKKLMNLQKINPNLDLAKNLLDDLMKLTENLKEYESEDFEQNNGDVEAVLAELSALAAQRDELRAARDGLRERRPAVRHHRQLQHAQLLSTLRETEEKDKKCREKSKRSLQIIEEIKERTIQYEHDKKKSLEELEAIKTNFVSELKSYEEKMIAKLTEAEDRIEKSLESKLSV